MLLNQLPQPHNKPVFVRDPVRLADAATFGILLRAPHGSVSASSFRTTRTSRDSPPALGLLSHPQETTEKVGWATPPNNF
jgi:hypothetical protein